MKRHITALALALAAWSEQDVAAIVRAAATNHGVSASHLVAVAECESNLDVYAVGALGELGIFQLRSPGELDRFYAYGYSDVWSPHEQADFTARRFAEGGAGAWSC